MNQVDNTDKEHIKELYQNGYGHSKISDILGLNANTVKSYIRRLPKENKPNFECAECGKLFAQTPHQKKRRFCSEDCRYKWWRKHKDLSALSSSKTFICQNCGEEFLDYGGKERKFCSEDCSWKSRRDYFKEEREESDARATPCGTELSNLPSDCLCTTCKWFALGKRTCCCKKALTEKI